MKKVRKILSVIISGIMLMSAVPSNAETVTYAKDNALAMKDWNVVYNTAGTAWNAENEYAALTKQDSKSADAALVINKTTAQESGRYMYIYSTLSKPAEAGKKYLITFYRKGGDGYVFNMSVNQQNPQYSTNFQQEPADDGWVRCTMWNYTVNSTVDRFVLIVDRGQANMLIDNISLKEIIDDGFGEELVVNGGFDDYTVKGEYVVGNYKKDNSIIFNDWTSDFVGYVDDGTQYMAPTTDEAKNGDVALVINKTTPREDSLGKYMRIHTPLVNAPTQGKKYRLSWWQKGGYGYVFEMVDYNNKQYSVHGTIPKQEDGWIYHELDFMVSNTPTDVFYLMATRAEQNLIIDDISLKEVLSDGTLGSELIKDGGFENVTKLTIKELVNPLVYPVASGNGVNISWTNAGINYDSIKVYLDDTQIEANVNLKANAFNQVSVSELENFRVYNIKIEASFGGDTVVFEKAFFADHYGIVTPYAGNHKLEGWQIYRNDSAVNYSNAVADIDYAEKVQGNSSIRMDVNLPQVADHVIPHIRQSVTLDRGIKYRLTFKAKTNGVNFLRAYEKASLTDEDGTVHKYDIYSNLIPNVDDNTTTDWTTYTWDLVADKDSAGNDYKLFDDMYEGEEYTAEIWIGVHRAVGSLWIDDVSIKAVNLDDNTTYGENLLVNGGFEYDKFVIEEPVYELVGEEEDEEINAIKAGKVRVTSGIRNVSAGDDFNASIAVALYDGGKLVSVQTMEKKLTEAFYYLPSEQFITYFDIPELDKGDYKIKVMYWNGLNTMTPIGNIDKLAEN